MRKKTKKSIEFLNDLHNYIVTSPLFRQKTSDMSEEDIQREIRPIIVNFLEKYFKAKGYLYPAKKAAKSFYWEGQEMQLEMVKRMPVFFSKNYPDFMIIKPFKIAIEYKKQDYGHVIKHGIGQSIMHTLSGDFDFVYFLFQDQSENKDIMNSVNNPIEQKILREMWARYNLFIKII